MTLRCTVCELPDPATGDLEAAWSGLVGHARERAADLVLLPEMPFHPWLPSRRKRGDAEWRTAVEVHRRWEARLSELGADVVAATRPIADGGRRYNEGFLWTPDGTRGVHRKVHLPDEAGFWEASCYEPGPDRFESATAGGIRVGFLVCTELWFLERARAYGADGVDVLLCPRATPREAADKWLAGGRVASVVSGAFCLSSNRSGSGKGSGEWAGRGWIAHPEHGETLAVTDGERPWVTVEIDPGDARRAKETYPRYVAG